MIPLTCPRCTANLRHLPRTRDQSADDYRCDMCGTSCRVPKGAVRSSGTWQRVPLRREHPGLQLVSSDGKPSRIRA